MVKTLSRREINNFRRLLNEALGKVTAPRIGAAVTCYAMPIGWVQTRDSVYLQVLKPTGICLF